ncbi:MAG: alpha-amylase family glycosyl hydrolase [Lentimicrobiaceae bacterium]|nr:alpha-amylase family glycosyl hydrolase [Lentimicrobiaceae bacterium]
MRTFSIKKRVFVFIFFLFGNFLLNSQIYVQPPLPTQQQGVEVIFDAKLGNKGLENYDGDVYAHTGVITNKSASPSDWKYVKASWGTNTPDCKLTKIGENLWKLTIQPDIRSYYSVPTTDTILQMAFVFRSANMVSGAWLEGKTENNGDIFYDVYPNTTNVKIIKPNSNFVFVPDGEIINIKAASINTDSILIYHNGELVEASALNEIECNIVPQNNNQNKIIAKGVKATETVFDTLCYVVSTPTNIAPMPIGIKNGVNVIDSNTIVFSLFAPYKSSVYIIGDFNNWLPDIDYKMNRTPDGKYYWLQVSNLQYDKEYYYQYLVDENIRIGDPYCNKVADPWNDKYIPDSIYPNIKPYPHGKTNGIASSLKIKPDVYNWSNCCFEAPEVQNLIIYELLIRDFSEQRSFQSVIDKTPYLKKLGVNAIELMPVTEFEGNNSWGYNPNYYFAIDKYYGHQNKLKELIDSCHNNGIAVILDVVFNHSFGTAPYVQLYWDAKNNRPAGNNPVYNQTPKHDFNVGYDINHESDFSNKLVSDALKYYIKEFNFDGFRFDLSKGFTQKNTLGNSAAMAQYDQSRVNILSKYCDTIKAHNPNAYVILEHFADNTEEKILSDKGMLLWGNINYNYGEAMMGYVNNSDLSSGVYTKRGWQKPHLISYMESHDEERQVYRCQKWGNSQQGYDIKNTATALKRAALASTFFYTIPGPKMLWQFGELGYDFSINYPSGTSDDRLTPKPVRWDYFDDKDRRYLFEINSLLINLKKNNPVFQTKNFDVNLSGKIKTIQLSDTANNIVVVGNFDVTQQTANVVFQRTGTWYELFSGDTIIIDNVNQSIRLNAGDYKLYSDIKIDFPYQKKSPESLLLNFSIYPNPTYGDANILLHVKDNSKISLRAFSVDGSNVHDIFNGVMSGNNNIKWQAPKKGLYIVELTIGNFKKMAKLIRL